MLYVASTAAHQQFEQYREVELSCMLQQPTHRGCLLQSCSKLLTSSTSNTVDVLTKNHGLTEASHCRMIHRNRYQHHPQLQQHRLCIQSLLYVLHKHSMRSHDCKLPDDPRKCMGLDYLLSFMWRQGFKYSLALVVVICTTSWYQLWRGKTSYYLECVCWQVQDSTWSPKPFCDDEFSTGQRLLYQLAKIYSFINSFFLVLSIGKGCQS